MVYKSLRIRSLKHTLLSRDMQQLVNVELKEETWNSDGECHHNTNEFFLHLSFLQNVREHLLYYRQERWIYQQSNKSVSGGFKFKHVRKTWACLLVCATLSLNITQRFEETKKEEEEEEKGNAATFMLHSSGCCLFPLFNRCRLEVVPNSKKKRLSFWFHFTFHGPATFERLAVYNKWNNSWFCH